MQDAREIPALRVFAREGGDPAAIRSVHDAAFGRHDEGALIQAPESEGVVLHSLVAELERRIVGHILFSRMWIDARGHSIEAVALAPMAVLPELRRRGIGGMLVRQGLDRLRDRGERIVLVLGSPGYYPRFGFSTGKASAIASPFPPEAFMALELEPGALVGVRGRARYAHAFGIAG